MVNKKVNAIFLCCIFFCSLGMPYYAYAVKDGNSNNPGPKEKLIEEAVKFFTRKKGWKKKILWLLIPVLVQITLSKIIAPILDRIYNQQNKELQMIKTLILVNKELKLQLDYIKRNLEKF